MGGKGLEATFQRNFLMIGQRESHYLDWVSFGQGLCVYWIPFFQHVHVFSVFLLRNMKQYLKKRKEKRNREIEDLLNFWINWNQWDIWYPYFPFQLTCLSCSLRCGSSPFLFWARKYFYINFHNRPSRSVLSLYLLPLAVGLL